MYFVPTIREDDAGPALMRVWFLRQANRLAVDTDVCDIPEFVHFVIAMTKLRCMEKESHPNVSKQEIKVEAQRRLMIETLSNMIPDDANEIEPEMMHYDEQS